MSPQQISTWNWEISPSTWRECTLLWELRIELCSKCKWVSFHSSSWALVIYNQDAPLLSPVFGWHTKMGLDRKGNSWVETRFCYINTRFCYVTLYMSLCVCPLCVCPICVCPNEYVPTGVRFTVCIISDPCEVKLFLKLMSNPPGIMKLLLIPFNCDFDTVAILYQSNFKYKILKDEK